MTRVMGVYTVLCTKVMMVMIMSAICGDAFTSSSSSSRNKPRRCDDIFSTDHHPLSTAFVVPKKEFYKSKSSCLFASSDEAEEEASRLRAEAEKMREQIREMEKNLGERRKNMPPPSLEKVEVKEEPIIEGRSLKNKRVLVCGANGRVGSMVCRYLLRNYPEIKEVVAAVHYVGEATSRGYGRLSYEVGAEDGVGTLGAAWSEDRNAYFEYSDEMKDYNLSKLRVMEVELLDPVQCQTLTEDVDSVIWCATDFNGNAPRAVSGLNMAFLFRAVASPTKGRVEIEGLQNILGALKLAKQDKMRRNALSGNNNNNNNNNGSSLDGPNDPVSFVLLSTAEGAFGNFETPFGEFNGLKRQGENMLRTDFPSLTHCIIQMGKYEDNFVDEGLDVLLDMENKEDPEVKRTRRINRRDVARAISDALVDDSLVGKTVEMWTASRGR